MSFPWLDNSNRRRNFGEYKRDIAERFKLEPTDVGKLKDVLYN